MDTKPRDPLLIAARVATIAVRVFLVIGMVGLGIGAAVVLLGGGGFLDHAAVRIEPAGLSETTGAILLVIAIGMAAFMLMYDFTTRLAEIIDTVSKGDPFIAGNAARLSRMGWLAVFIQALGVPVALLSTWLEPRISDTRFHIESNISLGGILLAILLFVLARVFREGARMREELEGTV